MSREPVVSINALCGLVLAVITIVGLNLSGAQIAAVEQIVGALVALLGPVIAGYVARRRVTPVSDVSNVNRRR